MNIERTWLAVLTVGLMVGLVTQVAWAQEGERARFQFQSSQSEMAVSGSSTVHDWTCSDISTNGYIEMTESVVDKGRVDLGKLSAVLEQSNGDTPATKLTVPVKKMHCSKDGMDPKMYKALKAKKYPNITFDLQSVSPVNSGDTTPTTLAMNTTGTLDIAGVQRNISMTVNVTSRGDSTLIVSGKKPLKMSQFNIERPTAMWGTIQAYDDITVKFTMLSKLQSES